MNNGAPMGRRGNQLWFFKQTTAELLSKLIVELPEHEEAGLTPSQADSVHRLLARIANEYANAPDCRMNPLNPCEKTLHKLAENMLQGFERWAAVKGQDRAALRARRKWASRMRGVRKQMTNRLRSAGAVLDAERDVRLINAIYDAFEDAVRSAPKLLNTVDKALRQIGKVLDRFAGSKPQDEENDESQDD